MSFDHDALRADLAPRAAPIFQEDGHNDIGKRKIAEALPNSKTGARIVHLGQPAVELLRNAQRIEGNPWVIVGMRCVGCSRQPERGRVCERGRYYSH